MISRVLTETSIKVDAKTRALVGQTNVSSTVTLVRFPMIIPLLMCRVYYGNGKQSELVRMICFQIEATIYFSGKYGLKSNYRLGEHKCCKSGYVFVETDMEHPPPRLRFADTNAACISDVELSSSNTCSYPVSYHLTIDGVAFTHQMTSLDHYLFTPKFLTTQSFAITRQHQKRLGPGKPSFVMVLANNIWTLVLFIEFLCSF